MQCVSYWMQEKMRVWKEENFCKLFIQNNLKENQKILLLKMKKTHFYALINNKVKSGSRHCIL